MVFQEPFLLEQFADKYEHDADVTLAETCCSSISISELEKISGKPFNNDSIKDLKLGYGWITGSQALKKEICSLYETIKDDDLVITNGGIGANFLTFYSLVNAGDHVIVVDPAYQQLSSLPKLFGGDVSLWKLHEENGWQPNLDELKSLINEKTRIIVLSSPNNPTGAFLSIEMVDEIVQIASERNIFIVSDEVYRPLFHSIDNDKVHKSIADLYERGISTSSMSKAFALAGLRLGWIASRWKPFIEDCLCKRDYNIISVSAMSDIIATYALQNKDALLERNSKLCRGNLKIIDEAIAKSNGKLSLVKPTAGTTCFLKIVGVTDTEKLSLDLIRDYKTLFLPGEVFGYPGFLRIGFGSSERDVTLGMENLLKYLN